MTSHDVEMPEVGNKVKFDSGLYYTKDQNISNRLHIQTNDNETLPSSFLESGVPIRLERDLDSFFIHIYKYYFEKGFWCILMRRVYEIMYVYFGFIYL